MHRTTPTGPRCCRPARCGWAVEASHPDGWWKYVGLDGLAIGVAAFGESAPAADVYRHFGLTAEAVAEALRARLAGKDPRAAGTGAAGAGAA